MFRPTHASLLILLLLAGAAGAQTSPTLLGDLTAGPGSSKIRFADGRAGMPPWSSSAQMFINEPASGPPTRRLFSTDGTAMNTKPVPEALPFARLELDVQRRRSQVAFFGGDPLAGLELRVLNLLDRQLRTVDLFPGPGDSFPTDMQRLTRNRLLYVGIRDFTRGPQTVLADLSTGQSFPLSHIFDLAGVQVGNRFISGTSELSKGSELGILDLSTRTTQFLEFVPGIGGGFPEVFATLGSDFVLCSAADATGDKELWRITVSTAQAVRVADLNPQGSALPANLTWLDDRILFTADDGSGRGLFRTDGVTITKLSPPGVTIPLDPSRTGPLPVVADKLLLLANEPSTGTEPWLADVNGTALAKDVTPGNGSTKVLGTGSVNGKWWFVTSDGSMYEIGWDGVVRPVAQKVDPSTAIANAGDKLVLLADGGPTIGFEPHALTLDAVAIEHADNESDDRSVTIRVSAPVLGKTMQIATRTVAPGGIVATIVGVPGTPLAIPGIGEIFFDLNQPLLTLGQVPASGRSAKLGVPVPNQQSLRGLALEVHNLHAAGTLGASNPVRIRLGAQ